MPYLTRSVMNQDLDALYEKMQCWDISYILRERLFREEIMPLLDKIDCENKSKSYQLKNFVKLYQLLMRDSYYFLNFPDGYRYAEIAACGFDKSTELLKRINKGYYNECDSKLVEKCTNAVNVYRTFVTDFLINCAQTDGDLKKRFDSAMMLYEFKKYMDISEIIPSMKPKKNAKKH